MIRAAFYILVGALFATYWWIVDPGTTASDTQTEWKYVLWFSGVVFSIAVAVPSLAALISNTALRASIVPASGATVSSFGNILEDGVGLEWAFFVFVLGTLVMLVGLLAVAAVMASTGRGPARLAAVVPVGTAAGIVLFPSVGGLILLVSWVLAAAVTPSLSRRQSKEPTRSS
jgi:hypothetical protein